VVTIINHPVHDGQAIATKLKDSERVLREGNGNSASFHKRVFASGLVRDNGAELVISINHVLLVQQFHGFFNSVHNALVLRLAYAESATCPFVGVGVCECLGDDDGDLLGLVERGLHFGLEGLDGVEGALHEWGNGFRAEGRVLCASAEL